MTDTPVTASADNPRVQSVLDQLAELDRLAAQSWAILDTPHYHLGPDGKPLELDGEPLLDARPTLAAIDTLNGIIGRRCSLLGLYAPAAHVFEVEL